MFTWIFHKELDDFPEKLGIRHKRNMPVTVERPKFGPDASGGAPARREREDGICRAMVEAGPVLSQRLAVLDLPETKAPAVGGSQPVVRDDDVVLFLLQDRLGTLCGSVVAVPVPTEEEYLVVVVPEPAPADCARLCR